MRDPAKHTPVRTVRVPDDVWKAAQQQASERGESVSAVVVRALEQYITQPPEMSNSPIR